MEIPSRRRAAQEAPDPLTGDSRASTGRSAPTAPGAYLTWVSPTLGCSLWSLTVSALRSDGLRRLGVHARDLTDTDSDQYPFTVDWAQAGHASGAEGVVWMSRQHNSVPAYCLFGDRVTTTDLDSTPGDREARVFATPADSEWLYGIALRIRLTIRPVS